MTGRADIDAALNSRLGLAGKVALVTGASQGIGLAIARSLAEAGAAVVMADRNDAVVQRADGLRAAGWNASALLCDVTRESDADRLPEEARSREGRLDILVNNAAILVTGSTQRLARAEWHRVVDTNLTACFFLAQSSARVMAATGGGAIISLSSMVGRTARRGLAAYIAAKAGIDGLTRALACDFAGAGIRANAVAPGFIRTEMSETGDADFERWVETAVPARRWGRPEDIAHVVTFLASDAGSYINGQTIYVDGGFTAVST